MNLLFLNYEYPPLGGGAGRITQQHAEGLAKLGHSVMVVTTWFEGEDEKQSIGNLTIIRVKALRKLVHASNPVEMLSWIKKSKIFLQDYLQNNHFDICIANFAIPGGVVASYLKRKFNLPYIIVSHGQDIPWFVPKQLLFYHLVCYFWLKNIFRHSLVNVIQTKKMKKDLDNFIRNKIEKNIIIPNGCDVQTFKPDEQQKSSVFKILFVGRLVEQKDPFTFLKAIKLYSETNSNFMVHVLGDGPLRRKMEQFVSQNHLKDNVKFLGWLSKEQMIEEYKSAHLQIAPSLGEGMSIALLESLTCGVYAIATPASGNSTLIEENVNGEIIKFGDHQEMANRIEQFYTNKFLTNYAIPKNFLHQFQREHAWDKIVNEYEKMLRTLIK